MNNSDLDKKYMPLYEETLHILKDKLGIEFNTELDDDNTYVDKRVSFGYAIFVLERIRVEQLTKEIQKTMTEGLDEMYELGRQSVIEVVLN